MMDLCGICSYILLALCFNRVVTSLSRPDCSLVEECATGTVVCDLRSMLEGLGLDVHEFNQDEMTLTKSRQRSNPAVSVINEAQVFTVVGTRLITRARVDREHYVLGNRCRPSRSSGEVDYNADVAGNSQPSNIACIILLELAIFPKGSRTQPQFVNLPVHLLDINDHAPRFDQHTSGLWLETDEDISSDAVGDLTTSSSNLLHPDAHGSLQVSREIATLPLAVDVDFGLNGTVVYSLEGPDAKNFRLDNGLETNPLQLDRRVRVKRLRLISLHELDHETRIEHRLTLLATDQCPILQLRQTAQLPITIVVKEVNEFSPVFDLGIPHPNTMTMDTNAPNARLHPAVHLDKRRETMQPNSKLTPTLNINREQPHSLTLQIPENLPVGNRIYRLLATDKDTMSVDKTEQGKKIHPQSKWIQYGMGAGADLRVRRYFRVGADDGWISLIHQLDYETGMRRFELPVVAHDAGRPARTGSLNLIIRVEDVNDEAPSIEVRGIGPMPHAYSSSLSRQDWSIGMLQSARLQTLAVRENSPAGTFVARISTKDRDSGPAGEVTCYLGNPLDYATKGTSISHPDQLKSSSHMNFVLQPASPTDLSSINSMDPLQSYAPMNPVDPVGRRDADYVLLTRTRLDREERDWHMLALICYDHGDQADRLHPDPNHLKPSEPTRSLSATSLIRIAVMDENDNGPDFKRSTQNAHVTENSVPGTRIVQLKAIDPDAPGSASRVGYRLARPTEEISPNRNQSQLTGSSDELSVFFTVDETTGWLRTGQQRLDRESRDTYTIHVVAFDMEFPNRTSLVTVHVEVLDENDNPPRLVGNTTFWVDEEVSLVSSHHHRPITSQLGSRQIYIGRLKAEDADLKENAQVSFRLAALDSGSDVRLRWSIRTDGSISVHPTPGYSLDREEQSVHFLPVILTDHSTSNPLTTTATVTIRVRDQNDNEPRFVRPSSNKSTSAGRQMTTTTTTQLPIDTVHLTDSVSPGTLIYTVLATDPDEGDNGRVFYSIEKYEGFWQLVHTRVHANRTAIANETNLNPYFIIEPTLGEIRVNQRVSNQHRSQLPKKLVIFAQDYGQPIRRSYAFLNIDFLSTDSLYLNNTMSSNTHSRFDNTASGNIVALNSASLSDRNPAKPESTNRFETSNRREKTHGFLTNGANAEEDDTMKTASRKGGPNNFIAWNSELITGLGIGLVVVILICLLLLVTYAIYGTKLAHTRPVWNGRGPRRMGKDGTKEPPRTRLVLKQDRMDTIGVQRPRGKKHKLRSAMQTVFNARCDKNESDMSTSRSFENDPFRDSGTNSSPGTYQTDEGPNRIVNEVFTDSDYSQHRLATATLNRHGPQSPQPQRCILPHSIMQCPEAYVCGSEIPLMEHSQTLSNDCSVCMETLNANSLHSRYTTLTEPMQHDTRVKYQPNEAYQTLKPDPHYVPLKPTTPGTTTTFVDTRRSSLANYHDTSSKLRHPDFHTPLGGEKPIIDPFGTTDTIDRLEPQHLVDLSDVEESNIPSGTQRLVIPECQTPGPLSDGRELTSCLRLKPDNNSSFV